MYMLLEVDWDEVDHDLDGGAALDWVATHPAALRPGNRGDCRPLDVLLGPILDWWANHKIHYNF